jgi:hypothetical protein
MKSPAEAGLFYWFVIRLGSARFASRNTRGGCRYMAGFDRDRQS